MNDQPLQTKPERATRSTAPVRGEHAAAGRPATSENGEARASRPKRRQARRKRPKRRFSLQKRYLEKRVIPSPGKRRCGQLIDRCEGGGNLKYKYTYTRTTCETHAASDRNAADVIRPGIRQQQKSGSSNTFAISLNRFICTKFSFRCHKYRFNEHKEKAPSLIFRKIQD